MTRKAAPLFVLSGIASLICQVIWQRILALASGVVLVSVIVAAFMLGLRVSETSAVCQSISATAGGHFGRP